MYLLKREADSVSILLISLPFQMFIFFIETYVHVSVDIIGNSSLRLAMCRTAAFSCL